MSPVAWQRLESAAVATAVLIASIQLGFWWVWLLILFLLFDLGALGYLAGTRIGAATYNAVHSYVGPAVAAAVALLGAPDWVGLLALAWAFHVAVDRALGYGLKERDSFQHTHLGWIGKARAAARERGEP